TPTDLLTKEEIWINKDDLARQHPEIIGAIPNDQLRAQLNNYLVATLSQIVERDEGRREQHPRGRRRPRRHRDSEPTAKQTAEAIGALVRAHPEVVDYYIRFKEDHG